MNRVVFKIRDLGRDTILNKIFRIYNISDGVILAYSLLSTDALEVVVSVLLSKLGMSKYFIILILALL